MSELEVAPVEAASGPVRAADPAQPSILSGEGAKVRGGLNGGNPLILPACGEGDPVQYGEVCSIRIQFYLALSGSPLTVRQERKAWVARQRCRSVRRTAPTRRRGVPEGRLKPTRPGTPPFRFR